VHEAGYAAVAMRVPTDKEIFALHEKYAPTAEALDLVYQHCLIVCGIAEQLHTRAGLDSDIDLVRAGCLLHDHRGVPAVRRGRRA